MAPGRSLAGARGARPAAVGFPLREAVALGLVHGPAELLPVSSSGHITLIAWLLDWSYSELAREARKDFEVALHAGTAAALLVGRRGGLAAAAWSGDRRAAALLGLALGPPALAGLCLESGIERLGTPRRIAGGLAVGSVVLVLADRLGSSARPASDAGPLDGLLLGLAQSAALVPGISRNGATLAVCRGRGFGRGAAEALSRDCGLPVILGASVLRAARLRPRQGSGGGPRREAQPSGWALRRRAQPSGWALRRRAQPSGWGPRRRAQPSGWALQRRGEPSGGARERPHTGSRLAAGAAAAFVSTLVARALLDRRDRPVSLVGAAAYRTLLAGVVLVRLARRGSGLQDSQAI